MIQYVLSQRIIVRSRPSRVRNPRTRAQQANRGKMGVASRFLAGLQQFVSQGFAPQEQANGRRVGAYHVALGRLLAQGMVRRADAWAIDYSRVELAEGGSLQPYAISVSRNGRVLRIEWRRGLPPSTQGIHLAVHDAKKGVSTCIQVAKPKRSGVVEVVLPKWASSDPLHLWWRPKTGGESRWASGYVEVQKVTVAAAGCLVAGRAMALPMLKGDSLGREGVQPLSNGKIQADPLDGT